MKRPTGRIDVLLGMQAHRLHPKPIEEYEHNNLCIYKSAFATGLILAGYHHLIHSPASLKSEDTIHFGNAARIIVTYENDNCATVLKREGHPEFNLLADVVNSQVPEIPRGKGGSDEAVFEKRGPIFALPALTEGTSPSEGGGHKIFKPSVTNPDSSADVKSEQPPSLIEQKLENIAAGQHMMNTQHDSSLSRVQGNCKKLKIGNHEFQDSLCESVSSNIVTSNSRWEVRKQCVQDSSSASSSRNVAKINETSSKDIILDIRNALKNDVKKQNRSNISKVRKMQGSKTLYITNLTIELHTSKIVTTATQEEAKLELDGLENNELYSLSVSNYGKEKSNMKLGFYPLLGRSVRQKNCTRLSRAKDIARIDTIPRFKPKRVRKCKLHQKLRYISKEICVSKWGRCRKSITDQESYAVQPSLKCLSLREAYTIPPQQVLTSGVIRSTRIHAKG